MNPEEFRNSPSGMVMKTAPGYWAFVPNPLPPSIEYDPEKGAASSAPTIQIPQ